MLCFAEELLTLWLGARCARLGEVDVERYSAARISAAAALIS
jgi:hypothetical protein